jgi:hypothetical protein
MEWVDSMDSMWNGPYSMDSIWNGSIPWTSSGIHGIWTIPYGIHGLFTIPYGIRGQSTHLESMEVRWYSQYLRHTYLGLVDTILMITTCGN